MIKILVKAQGKTIEHEGEIILVCKEMPANCMVLFLSMDTWREIKDNVELEGLVEG